MKFTEMIRRNDFLDGASLCLILGLPLLMVGVSMYHVVNIPLLDDYGFVLSFLNDYVAADTLGSKLQVLFSSSSNYLFVTFRVWVLIDVWLFGAVDFTHIVFVNNMVHLGIIYLFYLIWKKHEISLPYFLPVVLILAVPNFMTHTWPSYLSHVLAVFFTTATIYFCSKSTRYLPLTALAALLAILSSPVGILAFMAVLPFIGLKSRHTAIWIGFFLFTIVLYLVIIWPPGQELTDTTHSQRPLSVYAMNFVVFFGALFKPIYQDMHVWAGIFGLGICSIFLWMVAVQHRKGKVHAMVLAGFIFSFLLALLITLMRSRYGLGATTSYRYRLYQSLPLIFIYIALAIHYRRILGQYLWVICLLGMVFLGFRYVYNIERMQERNWQLNAGLHNLQVTGDPSQLSYRAPVAGVDILKAAATAGVYSFHEVQTAISVTKNRGRMAQLQPMHYVLDKVEDAPEYYRISGWAWLNHTETQNHQIYVVVAVKGERYYYRAGPLLNSNYLMKKSTGGFMGIIDKRKLSYDWVAARLGIAIGSPSSRIIAETMMP
ncbi:MAG: hypothetical protein HKN87_12365 [Saprospiraceae bacterium]|nr:hypothetical protein [Saprospiraceae bacterium]